MLQALGRAAVRCGRPRARPGWRRARRRWTAVDLSGLHPALAATRVIVASDVDNPLLGPTARPRCTGRRRARARRTWPRWTRPWNGGPTSWRRRWGARRDCRKGPLLRPSRRKGPLLRPGCKGGPLRPGCRKGPLLRPSRRKGPLLRPGRRHPRRGTSRGRARRAASGSRRWPCSAPSCSPGIGLLLDLVGFAQHLPGACLVVTGEGSLDAQTLSGKAPAGVAAAAREAGIPVVTVSGRVELPRRPARRRRNPQAYALVDIEPDADRCFAEAGPLLRELARTLANELAHPRRNR